MIVAGWVLRAALPGVSVHTPDEGVYASYATTLYRDGLGSVPGMLRTYNQTPELWVYPSPVRVGYLWILTGAMHLTQTANLEITTAVSAVFSGLSLVLLAWIAYRFFDPWVALVSLLFLAVSPLDLAIARRTWQEAVVACFALALVGAALAAMRQRSSPGWAVALLVLGGYALLIKETNSIVFALCALGLAVAWIARGRRRAACLLLGGAAATVVASATVLVATAGGIDELRAVYARLFVSGQATEYFRKYQTGGPMYYVKGLGILHPAPFLLGFVGCVLAILPERWARVLSADSERLRALRFTSVYVLGFSAVALLHTQKNLRFLSVIYAPAYLMAAALVQAIARGVALRLPRSRARVAVAVLGLSLVVLAGFDLQRFIRYFVAEGIPDLATPWFTKR
ncbi:MAG TPA: glycosyltransferase family 39 protein [Candidatus Limnocylindria bacterium]|nr:glycosyltransferase family 39 protein [Candidatus Limnocylindria bacterium]